MAGFAASPDPRTFPLAAPDPAADARWLARLTGDVAAAPAPLSATAQALGQARRQGYAAEAAALETLLTGHLTRPPRGRPPLLGD